MSHITVSLLCDRLVERNRTGAPILGGRRFVELFPEMAGRVISFVLNGQGIQLDPVVAEWLLFNGYLMAKRPGYWGAVGGDDTRLARACPAR